jgi:hypothetical protein
MSKGMTEKQWFAGVDWASENHHVYLIDSDGKRLGERQFRHGAGLAEMADWLIATSGGRFSPAGAKDDSRDAEVQADALRTDMRAFRKIALAALARGVARVVAYGRRADRRQEPCR